MKYKKMKPKSMQIGEVNLMDCFQFPRRPRNGSDFRSGLGSRGQPNLTPYAAQRAGLRFRCWGSGAYPTRLAGSPQTPH